MFEFLDWVGRAPRGLQVAWALWFAGLIVLAFLTNAFFSKGRVDRQESRLRDIERKLPEIDDKLGDVLDRLDEIRSNQLDWPEPFEAKHIGGPGVIRDTVPQAEREQQRRTASRIFETVRERDALVNLIKAGVVALDGAVLGNPGGDQTKAEGSGAKYSVQLRLRNTTDAAVAFDVPKGQVFENADVRSRVQNIVASKNMDGVLTPHGSSEFVVPGYCLNRGQKAPSGQSANITPLRVRFRFSNQGELWRGVESAVTGVDQ